MVKKILILVLAVAFIAPFVCAEERFFDVYTDKTSSKNHYAPSGWMGDYGDLSLDDQSQEGPFSGTTCIKIVYSGKATNGQGWAGIYWQNPPNNWGNRKGGFDLTSFNKLIFWAKGENGAEVINKIKIGGIKGMYPDSVEIDAGPFKLTNEWKQYSINLVGKDLSYISGGMAVIFTADQNPNGATVYLDDVRFTYEEGLKEDASTVEFPFYVYSDATSVDNHFIPSGWMGDYGDIRLDQRSTVMPYSGDTCIKIVYTAQATNGARWSGMYWQQPANNWGNLPDAGFDLTGATKLTFWARGDKGGERIEEFKIGGILGEFGDTDVSSIGPTVLTKEWKQYTIDLRGRDLSYIIGGFGWATNVDVNPEGCTFYIDDIKFEK